MVDKRWSAVLFLLLLAPLVALTPDAPSPGHEAEAESPARAPREAASVEPAPIVLLPASPLKIAKVGEEGNEPLIFVGKDDIVYISALQYLYRSENWDSFTMAGPRFAQHLSIASDSAITQDPSGRLYMALNAPYAGNTEVCTSKYRGYSWTCNNLAFPGPTDRQWIAAVDTDEVYLATNYGAYQTVLLESGDQGEEWHPSSVSTGLLTPQTGQMAVHPSGDVFQMVKAQTLSFWRWDGSLVKPESTGFPAGVGLPGLDVSDDGALISATERAVGTGTEALVVRSTDAGSSWEGIAVPQGDYRTWTFSWAASGPGDMVGLIAYATEDAGDPRKLSYATWDAVWVQTENITATDPVWETVVLEKGVHTGHICIAADCTDGGRFSGDYISAVIDDHGVGHTTWMRDTKDGPEIRYHAVGVYWAQS